MSEEGRTSVLKQLTASVQTASAEKQAAARKLTPVEGEAALPNDVGVFMSNERLRDHAKELRRFAADALAIADGLDAMGGETTVTEAPVDLDAVRKEKEREADEKAAEPNFNADFKAKQVEAQAKVFAADPAVASVDAGWVCPDHGKSALKTSAKTNRQYIGCPDCNQFKR